MAIHEYDTRHDEAARVLDDLVRQGYNETCVRAMLPALLGPDQAREDAQRWLSNNAMTGYGDMSDEARHAESVLGKRARTYVNSMAEEGVLGDEPYSPGARFAASDDTVLKMLDERAPIASPYGDGRNFQVVQHADADAELDRRSPDKFHMIDADNPADHWGN